MTKEYSPEELESRYENLPDVLKDAFFSPDVAEKTYRAGERAGLVPEKIELVAEEVGYFMLGLIHPKDFVKNLAERLKIGEEAAHNIARELNREIFLPLRDALRATHNVESDEVTGAASAAPPQNSYVPPHEPPAPRPSPPPAPQPQPPSPRPAPAPRPAPPQTPPLQRPPFIPGAPPDSKIPPIDLRQAPGTAQPPLRPRPPAPPRPAGYDPYRESVE